MRPYDWERERWWLRYVPLWIASAIAGGVVAVIVR